MTPHETPWLESPAVFADFLASWDTCTLPKPNWTHALHVAVSAAYAVRFRPDPLPHLRTGICRYNDAVGTRNTATAGYHETITRFWSTLIARHVAHLNDTYQAAALAVPEFGAARKLLATYYSYDVVDSREARQTWHAPDLIGPYGPIA